MATKTTTRGPRVRRLRATYFPRTCANDQAEATHVLTVPVSDGETMTRYLCDHDAQVAIQRGAVLDTK